MLECGIDAVIENDNDTADFLGGEENMRQMLADLFALKQNLPQQYALFESTGIERLREIGIDLESFLKEQEGLLESKAATIPGSQAEFFAGQLVLLKDIVWGLNRDLIKNQEKVLDLAGSQGIASQTAYARLQRLNLILNALDRLEVRGRDSTGIQISFSLAEELQGPGLEALLAENTLLEAFNERTHCEDLKNLSISRAADLLSFTYKTASITGKLGRNCKSLRDSVRGDAILRLLLSSTGASEMYLAHTRWASVGAINIPNCHPVNNYTEEPQAEDCVRDYPAYGKGNWFINVALNGDIDNYALLQLRLEEEGIRIDHRVTTDTKIIPLMIEKGLRQGKDLKQALLAALNEFEGSHAIAMESNLEPGKVYLAQRGSGQTIYVGLSAGQYLFSSEIYGLVEETPYFIKMDGEKERVEGDAGTRGQLFVLDDSGAADLAGIEACYYDGHRLELAREDIQRAEITSRDIDRAGFPHYLIKEILDAPSSVRKTLRGKYRIEGKGSGARVNFNLGDEVIPAATRAAIAGGKIRRIYAVGQGTAAVAGCAIAEALGIYLRHSEIQVQAKTASDLSGFNLDSDLSNTLVVAVTQSGTTTDTNRAVAMAKQNGAHVIAIVNRRQSDITTKSDGVYYTSDGRDIEMSVASTKAFYSQIIAGYVLALNLAQLTGSITDEKIAAELRNLEKIPRLMNRVIARREEIRNSAWERVREKKYWAVVGSGTNKVASDEVRIKLSELCYKTISSDIIEDKKHIDLSSEPLIIVMAAGAPEIVLEDIAKDSAIFKAHNASVVVIADEGELRFDAVADSVIRVPRADFPASVILNTVAGHIWGYYAAGSIDAQADECKQFRTALAEVVNRQADTGMTVYESVEDAELHRLLDDFSQKYNGWRSSGALATLSVDTATDIMLLLKYAAGKMPLEDFWADFEDKRSSSSPLDMLDTVLGKAIDELSRPVDAIRHQAKTVTVGTSRKMEAMEGMLFDLLAELNFSLENLKARDGYLLKKIQLGVSEIRGYTLYDVSNLDEEGRPTEASLISIVKRGGIAKEMHSRVENGGPLMGTKRTIVRTGDLYAGQGKADDASIVAVPLIGPNKLIENLLLVHVVYSDSLNPYEKIAVLGEKFNDLVNLVNEYNLAWRDDFLNRFDLQYLLGEAPEVIAEDIKKSLE